MKKLDADLLASVMKGFSKQAFVPMPGGQAEPVAGASMATAAMQAPMGAPQGGGAMPPPGQMAPQDPSMAGGGMMPPGGGMPPELMQMLGDPQVQQMLNQAGIMLQPDGTAIDGQTGQPIPPEVLMQVLQEMMGGMEGGGEAGGMPPEGMPAEGAPPAEEPQSDPVLDILTEIRDLLKSQKGGGEEKSEKSEGEGGGETSEMGQLVEEIRRSNDMMQQMMGGGM